MEWTKIKVNIHDSRWINSPKKIIRGKWHGYLMKLDLSNWSERLTYFLGRYYELGVQHSLSSLLEPGDRFVDIGANIGMITLHAAALVTETGEVECFEPNPECVATITENIKINDIRHVRIHPVGLSDSKGVLRLHLTSAHTGTATFADVDKYELVKVFEVQVLVGDDILLKNPKPVRLVKIDVEGFELHVLRGLKRTLDTFRPLLITEFVEEHFNRAGTSCDEIEQFLRSNGYRPYAITTGRRFLKHHLMLIPIEKKVREIQFNEILWSHPLNSTKNRLEKYISSSNS